MISLDINGKAYQVDVAPDVPLLWVIRERLQLTGTKFGCGIGMCGSCTVHIDGKAQRSCQTPVGERAGQKDHDHRGTSGKPSGEEGLDAGAGPAVRLLPAGPDHAGRGAALNEDSHPSDAKIIEHMNGNLCRCGTYPKIKSAIRLASKGGKK